MARETISLLSSSPRPAPIAQLQPKTAPARIEANTAVTVTSAGADSRDANANKSVVILSDDDVDDDDDLPAVVPAKTATREQPKSATTNTSNYHIPPLSSDDDLYSLPTLPVTAPMQSILPANQLKRDREFFFLSDDFDTTIDIDKSDIDLSEPVAKRVTTVAQQKSIKGLDTSSRQGAYKRSLSNIEISARRYNAPKVKNSRTASTGKILDSDPIVFTSSPDPYLDAAKMRAAKRDLAVKTAGSSIINTYTIPELSSDTAVSSDIDNLPSTTKTATKHTETEYEKMLQNREKEKPKTANQAARDVKSTLASEEKARKAAAAKVEKDRKRLIKEEKDKEKASKAEEKMRATELAKVNTLRTNKNVSVTEMIVQIPSSLNAKLRAQIEGHLENIKAEHKPSDSQTPVIRFQRKVTAEYNEDLDRYDPVKEYVREEKSIIYVMLAQEFVELVTKEEENNIDVFILQLKAKYEGFQIIILIEGYLPFIRKNRNIKVRQFTQNVRAIGAQPEEAPNLSQRRKKKEADYVDEELLEDAMLRLQVIHELKVHHTAVINDTAEQIVIFTQHISQIPYRSQRQPIGSSFCMESGQVKAGDGPVDTYVKMLQEIVRLTAPIAYGIQSEYPTVRKLIEGCVSRGPQVVEECRKSANKDGAFTDRRVGPAISKRVYRVFTGRDVNSLDV